jgi:hypothetical protein
VETEAIDQLELKLSRVKAYARVTKSGKVVHVGPYTNRIEKKLLQGMTQDARVGVRPHGVYATPADQLQPGDRILLDDRPHTHEVQAAHRVGSDVTLHVQSDGTGEQSQHTHPARKLINRVVLGAAAAFLAAGGAMALFNHGGSDTHTAPRPVGISAPAHINHAPAIKKLTPHPATTPSGSGYGALISKLSTPTTAAGYTKMFGQVPTAEWGAADVSISVPMPDGRAVWLYGDTLSGNNGFVHSTAITQDGGSLHVSQGGKQLLPDEHKVANPSPANPGVIYWISGGKAVDAHTMVVTARGIDLTGHGPWDFKDAGYSKTAQVHVDAAGDLTFQKWTGKTLSPAPDPGPLNQLGPHHYTYGAQTHPEAKLASGNMLVTVGQNWDDAQKNHMTPTGLRFQDYRPIFTEQHR